VLALRHEELKRLAEPTKEESLADVVIGEAA
jgi:hypothetical protein